MLKLWFHRVVLAHRSVAFVVMGLAFFIFGAGTLNLFRLLSLNLSLIADHGWMAVMDGAGWQLAELPITGYASLAAYLVFKTCEYALVHRLADSPP